MNQPSHKTQNSLSIPIAISIIAHSCSISINRVPHLSISNINIISSIGIPPFDFRELYQSQANHISPLNLGDTLSGSLFSNSSFVNYIYSKTLKWRLFPVENKIGLVRKRTHRLLKIIYVRGGKDRQTRAKQKKHDM